MLRVVADAVVVVHFGFILFVAVGALLAWRWPRLAWAHLPALAWGVGSVTIGFPCPLTGLEKAARRRAGGGYEGGFVDRYVEGVVYPEHYTSLLRALAAVLVVAGYAVLVRRLRAGQRGPRTAASACSTSATMPTTNGPKSAYTAEASSKRMVWTTSLRSSARTANRVTPHS